MLPSSWQNVRRLLVTQLGGFEDVVLTSPALRTLRQSLPSVVIILMVSPDGSQLVQLPYVDDVLVYEGAGFTSLSAERELALIELLSRSAFDAAVIFTNAKESPYPLAYICYLAGIPLRLGQSQEFGGSIVSEWVKSRSDQRQSASPVDHYLFLLESAGPSTLKTIQTCDHYVS